MNATSMNKNRVMYTMEFPIRCSPVILFSFLSTPVGLQEWFADKVDQRDYTFNFSWNGTTDFAEVLEVTENVMIKYRWSYYGDGEFFEFKIDQSPVTNETILRITDFTDKGDVKDAEQLWNSQIHDLKHRLGSL